MENQELDTVFLISSGYEWTCPHCDELNTEIEITETVECPHCKNQYRVEDADHAWE